MSRGLGCSVLRPGGGIPRSRRYVGHLCARQDYRELIMVGNPDCELEWGVSGVEGKAWAYGSDETHLQPMQ